MVIFLLLGFTTSIQAQGMSSGIKSEFKDNVLENSNDNLILDFYYKKAEKEDDGKYINDIDLDKSGFVKYNEELLPHSTKKVIKMYSFKTKFFLDDDLRDADLSLYIGPKVYPFNVYINGKFVYKDGTYKDRYNPSLYHSSQVLLSRDLLVYGDKPNILDIQIFPAYETHPFKEVSISDYKKVSRSLFIRNFFSVHLIQATYILSLVIFLYFIFLYVTGKFTDLKYHYFALLCFSFSFAYINVVYQYNSGNNLLLEKFCRSGFQFTISFLIIFVLEFTQILNKKFILKVMLLLPSFILTFVFFFQDSKYDTIYIFTYSTLFISAPFILFSIAIAVIYFIRKRNISSVILILSLLLIIPPSVHDTIYMIRKAVPFAWLTAYGFVGFLLGVFFLMAKDKAILYEDLLNKTKRLKELNKNQKKSIKEKETLIKEIHHRVKNNFQIINSLISLQLKDYKSKDIKQKFNKTQNRILSMALIHENLYQSETLSEINLSEYIKDLTTKIYDKESKKSIKMKLEIDDALIIDLDIAIPCGLIINELLLNALYYAFPESDNMVDCEIIITAYEIKVDLQSQFIYLSISDNGVGLPESLNISDTKTLGLRLAVSLAEQINAVLKTDRTNGIKYEMKIPLHHKTLERLKNKVDFY